LTQSVPDELHRCHWKPNDVGVGDQVPRDTRSSSPTVAEPLTAGRTELVGPDFESTTSVGSDVAVALPSVFDAVTATRSVLPTSVLPGEYVCFVAPVMSPQTLPSEEQRRHWYAKAAGVFVQVPFDPVRVASSFAEPLIWGTALFSGAAAERADATVPATPQATIMAANGMSRRRAIMCLRMGYHSFIEVTCYRFPMNVVFTAASHRR
jgi:hypothetical protein